MTKVATVMAVLLIGSYMSAQLAEEPKPVPSKDPLTAEQVAIYRAVLRDYMRGNETGALNLANKTDPIDLSGTFFDESCLKGISINKSGKAELVIHIVDASVALSPKMVFVDPDRQGTVVKENDPSTMIRESVESGQKITDDDLETSVKRAFATGLFSLSEIAFDRRHAVAVVQYSFWCGRLCGHGATVVLKKVSGRWKIKRRCGNWIS